MGGRSLGWVAVPAALALAFVGVLVACGSGRDGFEGDPDTGTGEETSSGFLPLDGGFTGDVDPGLPVGETRDPETCEEAKTTKSYVGCDYWPTVTPNSVWSIFDFAVVVANTGTKQADITVTGPNGTNKQVSVPAGELKKIYLPWVTSLKGPDMDACGATVPINNSVVEAGGAYHLVSTTPVIVYQFNALEYKGQGGEAPGGGPKDWSSCPGTTTNCPGDILTPPYKIGCFSFTNDASLLLPSTAMTGNYRVVAQHGWSEQGLIGGETKLQGSIATVTATAAATEVTVTLAPTAKIVASTGGTVTIPATNGGGTLKFTLANAGDVAQLVTDKGKSFDFSGSLIQANKPIQVISSVPCINLPAGKPACDHIEESVLPAETLGKRYVVPPPTGPKGQPVAHNVRFYGNKDGTNLTYVPTRPTGCPATLNAGQVVDCGIVSAAFDVSGTNEFAVATFPLGAAQIDPAGTDLRGDPDESTYASIEQFRTKYLFLAPEDYAVNYVDIVAAEGSGIELDGKPVTEPLTKVGGTSQLGVIRVKLGAGKSGAHMLTSKSPVGIQVMGYGDNTSYQYPGGLNLKLIAPPPPPPK
jgi:hypothetical protein